MEKTKIVISPKRILTIRLSSLGDIIQTLPAIHHLKKTYNCPIDFVCQREYELLVKCLPDINRIIFFPRRKLFRNFLHFFHDLRKFSYDISIDFHSMIKSSIVTLCANSQIKAGAKLTKEPAWIFYNMLVSNVQSVHPIEKNMQIVEYITGYKGEIVFNVSFPNYRLNSSHPRILIFPISRWSSKNWPSEYFVETGKLLKNKYNATIIICGSRNDEKICEYITESIGNNTINLCGKLNLAELGGLIKESNLIIANDSGPVHIADAVGTPCVVVFGPTSPERTGPYRKIHSCITPEVKFPCIPCFKKKCNRSYNCISTIKPETVVNAAKAILEKSCL